MLFTDTVTLYNKTENSSGVVWTRKVIQGVQWSDKTERQNNNGRISVARYVSLTFPEGTYEGLTLEPGREEDAIFYGNIDKVPTDVKGNRISDLMKMYPRSGRIQAVNDNSNRRMLKSIKVILG